MAVSATSVFNTSELFDLIFDYSGAKERVHIACTSRVIFPSAASRIWRSLNSAQPLLMLLSPELTLHETESKIQIIALTLPAFSLQTFKRFDLYSDFVRRLTISTQWKTESGKSIFFFLSSWSPIVSRAQLGPLLTNLATLEFTASINYEQLLLWLSSFISPGLHALAVRVSGSMSILPMGLMVTDLALVAQKCLTLKHFEHNFSLVCPTSNKPETDQAISRLLLLPVACEHFRSFEQLSSLSIGGYFVTPESLLILSELPLLEYLDIKQIADPNEAMPHVFSSTPLVSSSFPSLSRLRLSSRITSDFLAVLGASALANRVKRLASSSVGSGTNSLYREPEFSSLISVIRANCPHIWHLWLGGECVKESGPVSLTSTGWSCLSQTPITHLELHNFHADETSMKAGFPLLFKLKFLKMPHQILTLEQLVGFSQLCELQCFCIRRIEFSGTISESSQGARSPLQKMDMDEILEEKIAIGQPGKVARFLISLWPKLHSVNHQAKEPPYAELDLLNLHLQVLQGIAETENNISARFGPGVASSLLSRQLSSLRS